MINQPQTIATPNVGNRILRISDYAQIANPLLSTYPQIAVHNYCELGLNVILQPWGRKKGWHWKLFQYYRLNEPCLLNLIELAGQCNLAVMTGRSSGNLFILDCETKSALEQQCRELSQRNIPLLVSRSNSPKGGGHIWLRCQDGEILNIPNGTYPGMEIRGRLNYILVPPSIHESGSAYSWHIVECDSIPIVSVRQIDWLALKLAKVAHKNHTPRGFSRYSKETQDFIAHGAPESTRNPRLYKAACDVLGCGDDPEILLRNPARVCGLPDYEITHTLNSAASETRQPSNPNTQVRKVFKWQRAIAWAKLQHWTGRIGTTDKQVWNAICQRAHDGERKGIFRASEREISELSSISRPAVRKALARFVRDGWLIVSTAKDASGARCFSFGKAILQTAIEPVTEVLSHYSPLIERGALGINGLAVYRSLLEGSKAVSEVQAAHNLSRPQVEAALKRLQSVGAKTEMSLIYPLTAIQVGVSGKETSKSRNGKIPRKWQAIPRSELELAMIAERCGVADRAQRRAATHSDDRAIRAVKIVEKDIFDWNKRVEMRTALSAEETHDLPNVETDHLLIADRGLFLFNAWQSFSNPDRRDDWYNDLTPDDKLALIDHRMALWRQEKMSGAIAA